jgi:glycosyltransferase involved in cell wall biosynthesis
VLEISTIRDAKARMRTLNVILFTDADVFAGTERHMLDLATGLRALNVNVTTACPRPGALAERADAAGIPVLNIPKLGNIDRNAIHVLSQRLISGETDLIHAHNGRTHIAAAFAVKKAGRGCCIATQHFLSPARTTRTGLKKIIANHLHRKASRFTAHTIAISDAVRNAALARGDDAPEKITTVLNGISQPAVPSQSLVPDPPGIPTVRYTAGVPQDASMIFCAARLQPEKDIPTLIRAMPAVLDAHPTAHCVIAGEGDQRAAIEAAIRDEAQRNPAFAQSVRLLGFRNDIPGLMNTCDLFVLPALAEPFGLVILEAMALGKPVIATSTGGPPEIVAHEKTGILVAPQNPAALANAINQLLANRTLHATMGEAGKQRYLTHFTVDRMARDILNIYTACLGTRQPGN